MNLVLLGMLGVYALEDWKKMKISTGLLWIFALAGLAWIGLSRAFGLLELLGGVMVGLGIMGLSVLSRGSIGMGDGVILAVTGIYLGVKDNLELLLLGLLYAAAASLLLLVFGKKKRKQEIPFVPFLFLGYATMLVGSVVGERM